MIANGGNRWQVRSLPGSQNEPSIRKYGEEEHGKEMYRNVNTHYGLHGGKLPARYRGLFK